MSNAASFQNNVALRTHREGPHNRVWDRVFFSGMILLTLAVTLFGFSRTYFMAGMVRAPLPNRLVHVHAAAFTLWMVLLLVQTTLIAARRVRWHKSLGIAGFGFSVVIVVLGVMVAADGLRRGGGPPGFDPVTFSIVPFSGIVLFAVLLGLAYRARYRAAEHKRYILVATLLLMDAPLGRAPFHALPVLFLVTIAVLLLALPVYDLISLHRVHRATLIAEGVVIALMVLRLPIGATAAWHRLAALLSTI